MKKNIILMFAFFLLCGLFNNTYASLLEIRLTSASIEDDLPLNPGTHDVTETAGKHGWYNANLYATADVNLTYEYLGFEAGWTNAFVVGTDQVFWNYDFGGNLASIDYVDTATSSAGPDSLLKFAFQILEGGNDGGNAGYGVVNGLNVAPYGVEIASGHPYSAPNFFLGYVPDSPNSVYITLDDGGGQHWRSNSLADDNHDDLVIKVTATAVPEPATLLLLGSGLVGIGAFRKKFKK